MDILNSWKEIAAYLGRGVRTAQRWERCLGLPVHRPKGTDRSAVLAFAHELEAWLHHTPVRSQLESEIALPNTANAKAPLAPSGAELSLSDVDLSLARAHQLRLELAEITRRQQVLTAALTASLQKIARSQRSRGAAA